MYRKTSVSESFFGKVTGLQACNFIKKRLQHKVFPVDFAKFLKTLTLKNICEQLLLKMIQITKKKIKNTKMKEKKDATNDSLNFGRY